MTRHRLHQAWALIMTQFLQCLLTKTELIIAYGNDLLTTIKLYSSGLLFFNIGYYLILKNIKQKEYNFSFFKIDEKSNFILFLGFLTFFCYYILFTFNDNFYIGKLNQAKNPLMFFYMSCFWFYFKFKNSNYLIKTFLLILILLPIYNEILTGLMTLPFLIAFYLYLLNFLFDKKFYFKQIFFITLIFIILNTNKEFYRKVVIYNYQYQII